MSLEILARYLHVVASSSLFAYSAIVVSQHHQSHRIALHRPTGTVLRYISTPTHAQGIMIPRHATGAAPLTNQVGPTTSYSSQPFHPRPSSILHPYSIHLPIHPSIHTFIQILSPAVHPFCTHPTRHWDARTTACVLTRDSYAKAAISNSHQRKCSKLQAPTLNLSRFRYGPNQSPSPQPAKDAPSTCCSASLRRTEWQSPVRDSEWWSLWFVYKAPAPSSLRSQTKNDMLTRYTQVHRQQCV